MQFVVHLLDQADRSAPQTFQLPLRRHLPIQIYQNFSRLSAFVRTDDAAFLQQVHDPSRTRVADAQAALQDRDAGAVGLADDLDALLDEFLVFIAGFVVQAIGPSPNGSADRPHPKRQKGEL